MFIIFISSKIRNSHINTRKLIIVINVTFGVWSNVYLLISFEREIFKISKNIRSPSVKGTHSLIYKIHINTGIIDPRVDKPTKCFATHTIVINIGNKRII
jgi:hypothetical protein